MWKWVLIIVGALALLLLAFFGWYTAEYGMDKAKAEVHGNAVAGIPVLIATQGSPYKNLVLSELLEKLEGDRYHMVVIDVTGLPEIRAQEWSAIVVIHTWEGWEPQPDAAAFVLANTDHPGLIVLSTSGSGEEKLDPVDGISSASVLENAPHDADWISGRISASVAQWNEGLLSP